MDTVVKTVKQYSLAIESEDLDKLKYIGEKYRNVKNYVYSRFSGIKSLMLIERERDIRDDWVRTGFHGQWKLPARYWKLALTEAVGNIKSEWSNIKNRVRDSARRNENLIGEELHYVMYALKVKDIYYWILNGMELELPKAFQGKDIRLKYLNSLIRRLTRKHKGRISHTRKLTFSIDTGLYRYEEGVLHITTREKGRRVRINLTDRNTYDRTMTVVFSGRDKVEIHCPVKVKKRQNTCENTIGIDKGYKDLLAVSTGNFYGKKLNVHLGQETERLNRVNSLRNRFHALMKRHIDSGNYEKARRIEENNLGKEKYASHKKKYDQTAKSYINSSINEMIRNEEPGEIVMENLDFTSWDDRYPKQVRRKLSRWIKGYIRERLEYKCELNRIKYTYVNPAYTSQTCSRCGEFGTRENEKFTCGNCGTLDADHNASVNILKRKDDKEITLYTSHRKVKEILHRRAIQI